MLAAPSCGVSCPGYFYKRKLALLRSHAMRLSQIESERCRYLEVVIHSARSPNLACGVPNQRVFPRHIFMCCQLPTQLCLGLLGPQIAIVCCVCITLSAFSSGIFIRQSRGMQNGSGKLAINVSEVPKLSSPSVNRTAPTAPTVPLTPPAHFHACPHAAAPFPGSTLLAVLSFAFGFGACPFKCCDESRAVGAQTLTVASLPPDAKIPNLVEASRAHIPCLSRT